MSPRPAAAPDMAPTVLDLLTAGRFDDLAELSSSDIKDAERDFLRRHAELAAEKDALQRPDPTETEGAVLERARREIEVGSLIRHVEAQQTVLSRARKQAMAREVDQAGEAFALTAQAALLAALEAAEEASAAFQRAQGELEQIAARLFDPSVRRRLQADPTTGIRVRILALLPRTHALANLVLAGEPLVTSNEIDRWPRFVDDGSGNVMLEGTERLRDRPDYLAWRSSMARLTLPAGCQAARALAELEQRFG